MCHATIVGISEREWCGRKVRPSSYLAGRVRQSVISKSASQQNQKLPRLASTPGQQAQVITSTEDRLRETALSSRFGNLPDFA